MPKRFFKLRPHRFRIFEIKCDPVPKNDYSDHATVFRGDKTAHLPDS